MSKVKKYTITLEFEGQEAELFSRQTETCLATLFRDALGEFVAVREPAAHYVARRYTGPGVGLLFLKAKQEEVERRCEIASALKRAKIVAQDETWEPVWKPSAAPSTPNNEARCRYEDCPEAHKVASDEERVTCATCRRDLGHLPLSE